MRLGYKILSGVAVVLAIVSIALALVVSHTSPCDLAPSLADSKDVKRFNPEGAVFGGRFGAFAEYFAVREDGAIALKPGVTFEQAVAVLIVGLTPGAASVRAALSMEGALFWRCVPMPSTVCLTHSATRGHSAPPQFSQ